VDDSTLFNQICKLLQESGVSFRSVEHEPTPTSEDSARARGEELKTGGKALLLKCDQEFRIFVISAAKKLSSKKARQTLGIKSLRFATKEELLELTGLVPGSLPPFGHPILPFPLVVDRSIYELERIAFNAGSLTRSIVMAGKDYLAIVGLSIVGGEAWDLSD